MAFKEKVFSGVQPSGNLHLGNYLGAITKFVALQERYDCIYCVVDMHAITVWQDPNELPKAVREATAAFIALLRWIDAEFSYWSAAEEWSPPTRLALTWVHTHRLFSTFIAAAADPDWIREAFGVPRAPLDVLETDAHRRIDVERAFRPLFGGHAGVVGVLCCHRVLPSLVTR